MLMTEVLKLWLLLVVEQGLSFVVLVQCIAYVPGYDVHEPKRAHNRRCGKGLEFAQVEVNDETKHVGPSVSRQSDSRC
jgi:hypothetical protein